MKCPKCSSTATRRVGTLDSNWRAGHQRCLSCRHQDEWGLFCEPPLPSLKEPAVGEGKVFIPSIDADKPNR